MPPNGCPCIGPLLRKLCAPPKNSNDDTIGIDMGTQIMNASILIPAPDLVEQPGVNCLHELFALFGIEKLQWNPVIKG